MEVIMAIAIGFLFMAAVYLMLSKSLLRIIIGTGLLSHGAHLLILTMGGLGGSAPPVLSEGVTNMADAIPQALILTAIVISFGVTAFFLVLAYRAYQELGTDDMNLMRGTDEDDE
ncbi:Na(+)/H(+) antiporter subunit C [Viridibacillus sp. FSL R5-0477]|jgi:multicomponent Na+:H+ antiporter subunit C|uniref:Monovalent cation/H+ antiporter subunit C n=2 Tax=Viridibacillus TaxID=496496 RepID=W4EMZ4_9BACL|nr:MULTISPECIES: Na(+)/H(+) antiporter subunit C [Viridibacillus]ETT81930.1 monovalent cation/H+ antiporter subunit C [Viridibacillus arenosi FSL R5-213]KOO47732.1 cation:proton antiporter [Viridibacillus arvi]OMC81488.1 Na(+)/H(+) antiporter subunit C [Viridibacillus sp. FSL H8-0123]OMC86974.1 Na(+)/H(+) antiporter subunit C [Viridibacillus sp. FSL H7-0596]OMC90536.1 Na(+)/H(+) antiporter subunit C [Viridibacillus arenosi]